MPQDNKAQAANSNGLAFGVTSLVTGIIAFLSGWIFFISIPVGVVAIVFGALGMKKSGGKGLAIAGLVTGIVGAAFGLGLLVIGLIASFNASAPSVPVETHTFFYR